MSKNLVIHSRSAAAISRTSDRYAPAAASFLSETAGQSEATGSLLRFRLKYDFE